MAIVGLAERDAARVRALRAAAARVEADLSRWLASRGGGGRFVVYGSLVAGTPHPGSDLDIALDFPPELEAEAWTAAETACAAAGMTADVRPLPPVGSPLRERIDRTGRSLG